MFTGKNDLKQNDIEQNNIEQNNIEQNNIEQNDISDNIREGSYRSLLNMARTITSSLNDEKILHIILQETISVLPGADTGFLYLYDEEKNRLFLKARIGFRHEYHEYDNVNLKVGEAISGKTFQYGQSLILNGVEKVINYSSDMTDENMNNYLQLTSQQDFPRAVISTVLKAQSKILGVLTIDNFSSPIDFTEEDLQLLQAAADHAAVVISQAQLLRREKQYLKKMELMNQKLYKEHSLLEKTLNIHNQLISIALEGKGFGRIVGFLAKMIACPVTVFDLYLKPMAVSDNAQDKALPDNLLSCEEMKKLLYTQEKQRIFLEDPLESIHLLPVIGANKILGILGVWVAEDQQLSDLDNVVLNYTTMIIAMEWIKQDAILETSQKLKGEFMQGVLWGNLDRGLLEHSKQLGLDMEDFFAVILFSIVEDQAEQNLSIGNYQNKQILHSIINLLEKQHLKGIVNAEKDYLCLLLSTKDNKQNNANKDIDLLCQKLRQIYPLMRIGIGRLYKGLHNIRNSYREASQCIKLMDNYDTHSKTISYGGLGFLRLVLNQNEGEIKSYIKDILLPVIEYDRKRGGELLETILCYTKHNKSLNAVGETMNIHNNTAYTRIKRVEKLLGVDFDNTQDWMNIQIACMIYEMIGLEFEDLSKY